MRAHRQGLAFLCSTVILALLLVSTLKGLTHIDCPWSFQRYGGERAYEPIFQKIFGSGNGRCFPSGHASGGYAWIALYFYCLLYKPRWRYVGLAFGLLLGLTFGLAQQLRGAHFVSHDIWTLTICWYTGLLGYVLQRRLIARLEAGAPAEIASASLPERA
nr:phosphatase PAP2 family protein [Pseudomaricurvus alcaniphilus]